ncbi:hypothetical protein K503DRAFT_806615 [Rhizopogon vinicolor AM-OR11-026]|uniref:Uncharacterized protein n=1 Tax=Rhizopogon vinicolor AM-OR11-026 TaxID=1314800 RepID=A0A1B7ME47_9AGAM|nr:hypothetical protein K503DRAFT_806615 [Rhizopogon vinicolor AM-OR11-026]
MALVRRYVVYARSFSDIEIIVVVFESRLDPETSDTKKTEITVTSPPPQQPAPNSYIGRRPRRVNRTI